MDEFTANPYETEKEAQRVLRKMQADKNVAAAKAAESKAGVEESRAKLREMGYLKGGDEDVERKPQPKYMTKAEVEAQKAKLEAYSKTNPYGSKGGGGGMPMDKMDKMKKMNYKAGGKVKTASKRADGCAIRGKTRA